MGRWGVGCGGVGVGGWLETVLGGGGGRGRGVVGDEGEGEGGGVGAGVAHSNTDPTTSRRASLCSHHQQPSRGAGRNSSPGQRASPWLLSPDLSPEGQLSPRDLEDMKDHILGC